MNTVFVIDGPSVRGVWKNIMHRQRLPYRHLEWHKLLPWGLQQFGDCRAEMVVPDWFAVSKGELDFKRYLISEAGINTIGASRELMRSGHPSKGLSIDDAAVISRMHRHAREGNRIIIIGHDHIHAIAGLALRSKTEVLPAGFPEDMAREYGGFPEVFDLEFDMGLVPPTGRFGEEAA